MCARFTIDGQVISQAVELAETHNPELRYDHPFEQMTWF